MSWATVEHMTQGDGRADATRAGRPGKGDGRPTRESIEGLTGSGSSIVGVEGAMYARDGSRPGPADLAAGAAFPVRRASPRPDR